MDIKREQHVVDKRAFFLPGVTKALDRSEDMLCVGDGNVNAEIAVKRVPRTTILMNKVITW